MSNDEIERALVDIVQHKDANLPEHVRANHYSLVRAGEYSVALDFVEDWIAEEGRPISAEFYSKILDLRKDFGQRGRCEDYIRAKLLES